MKNLPQLALIGMKLILLPFKGFSWGNFLLLPFLTFFFLLGIMFSKPHLTKPIGVTIIVIATSAVGLGVWFNVSNRKSSSKQKPTKSSNENIAKLKEQIHTAEKALEDVLQKKAVLMNREVLKNQWEQFKLERETVQIDLEENKKRRNDLEKTPEKNKDLMDEKKRLLDVQCKLEGMKDELERLQLNVEELLQNVETESFQKVRELKRELDNRIKQLKEELGEGEEEEENGSEDLTE